MPEKKTVEKAKAAKRAGKSDSTAAGEFVREEMHHVREGKHGARSTKQAIAIGLSEARRAGVAVKPPKKGEASEQTRAAAKRDVATGEGRRSPKAPSKKRSDAAKAALKREPKAAASTQALAAHGRTAAAKRTKTERSASAKKAASSRTAAERSASAEKGARTRARKAT